MCAALRAQPSAQPELVLQLPHGGFIGALRFSADDKTLAVCGQDDTIRLWDVETGLLYRTLPKGDRPYSFPRTAQGVQSLRASGAWRGRSALNGIVLPNSDGEIINDITLSPDERFVARVREEKPSGYGRGFTVIVSDAKSGKVLWKRLVNFQGGALFSPTGQWLVKLTNERTGNGLQFFRVADGQPGGKVRLNGGLVKYAFSTDGKSLYTQVSIVNAKGEHSSSRVQFWSVPDAKLIGASAELKGNPVDTMVLPSSRGGRVYLIRTHGSLVARETLTGRTLWQQKVVLGNLQAAEFSDDGRFLATAGYVWKMPAEESSECVALELRDAHSGRLLWERDGSPDSWGAVGITALDDGRLQTGGSGGLRLWNMATGQPETLWRAPLPRTAARDQPRKIGYSPDGKTVIQTAPISERTRMPAGWELRDAASGEVRATLKVPTGGFVGAGSYYFSPSGRYLAVTIWTDVEGSGSFGVFDTQSGKGIKGFASQGVSVSDIAFSRDEKLLASAHIDGTVNLFTVPDGTLLGRLLGVKSPVNTVAFAPAGTTLVGGYADGMVRVWNLQTQEIASQWQAHRSALPSPYHDGLREGGLWKETFSPDGTLLATCGVDGTAKIWDAQNGALKATLAHDFAVKGLAFLPNGTLTSSADDGGIRLWNPHTGKLLATLVTLPSQAGEEGNWIAFTPEGFYDATPGADRFIAWRMGDKVLPAAAFTGRFHRPDLLRAALSEK